MRCRFFPTAFARMRIAAVFCSAASLFAQAPISTPPTPQPQRPTGAIVPPGFSLDVQPGTTAPTPPTLTLPNQAIEPGASASFEPSTARIGRPVEYRIAITASERVMDLPPPAAAEGLRIEQGARGFSASSLNGQMVITSTLRYSAIPLRSGEITIPGFPLQVGTKRVQIPAATLIVNDTQPGEATYQPVRSVIEVPKRDFFVGETIDAKVMFFETPDEQPQFVQHVVKSSGSVIFKPNPRSRTEQVMADGRRARALIMPVQITPLVAGETEVNCQVIVHVSRSNFSGRGILTQSTIDVPSAHFRVLPLPDVRPAGFTGAVGQLAVAQPKLSAPEVEVGEPLVMTVAVSGDSNIDGVPAPELEANPDWNAYRPTSELQRDEDGSGGMKVFTYTLISKQEGRRGTPAIPFAYFDPVKKAFVDVTIPPQPVVVKASSAAPAAPASAPVTTESSAPSEPPREAEPTLTGLAEKSGAWNRSLAPDLKTFFWLQIIPPMVLLALWLWRRRTEYLAAHPEIIRRRRSRVAARKALAAARAAARRGDSGAFVQASLGALREAAAPLDSADATSLTREEVLRQLREDERATRAATTIFESADALRYSSHPPVAPDSARLIPDLEHAVARLSSRA